MLRRIAGRRPIAGPKARSYKRASSAAELESQLEELGRDWMYGFDLGHGVKLDPFIEYLAQSHDTRWRMIEPELVRTFTGRWSAVRALDSACNEGWWSFQIARLGAKSVVGFDARLFNINRAEFVKAQTEATNVEFRIDDVTRMSVASYGEFDLTLCLGLLYHLEDPMGALRRLRAVTRELLVIETEVARPGVITIDRGPEDGLVTTEHVMAVVPEPYYKDNSIASITGLSIIPSLTTLKYMLTVAGFSNVTVAEPVPGGAERYLTGDRVVVFARV